ncbi:hypothetical protein BC829DRAFT_418616 [Chytridium lagenaria]|nr:hypothetical protein BC829DRAFT_418616 [Chytridium lagenaria]
MRIQKLKKLEGNVKIARHSSRNRAVPSGGDATFWFVTNSSLFLLFVCLLPFTINKRYDGDAFHEGALTGERYDSYRLCFEVHPNLITDDGFNLPFAVTTFRFAFMVAISSFYRPTHVDHVLVVARGVHKGVSMYLSMNLAQALENAFVPMSIYIYLCSSDVLRVKPEMMFNLMLMVVGSLLSEWGSLSLSTMGMFTMAVGLMSQIMILGLLGKLLKSKNSRMDAHLCFDVLAPVCLLISGLCFLILEASGLSLEVLTSSTWQNLWKLVSSLGLIPVLTGYSTARPLAKTVEKIYSRVGPQNKNKIPLFILLLAVIVYLVRLLPTTTTTTFSLTEDTNVFDVEASQPASYVGEVPEGVIETGGPGSIDIVFTVTEHTKDHASLRAYLKHLRLHPFLSRRRHRLRLFVYTTIPASTSDPTALSNDYGATHVEFLSRALHRAAVPVSFITNRFHDLAERVVFLEASTWGGEVEVERERVLEGLGVLGRTVSTNQFAESITTVDNGPTFGDTVQKSMNTFFGCYSLQSVEDCAHGKCYCLDESQQ